METKRDKIPKCGKNPSSIKSGLKNENKNQIKQIKVNLLPRSIFLLLPQRVTWRGNRGTSSSHAGFYSSQVALMAVSSIYSVGTVSKRTRSGALASNTHTHTHTHFSLSKPIKESRKARRQEKTHSAQVRKEYFSL